MSLVTQALHRAGLPFEVLPHTQARTALSEAIALGVPPDEVAKTLVLDIRSGHAMAVIPASCRLDMRLLRHAVGEHGVHLAEEEEIAVDFPEFELGATPPLPMLVHVPLFVAPEMTVCEKVVFAAGNQQESVRVPASSLFPETGCAIVPLVRH